jgi:hypothetical protein
MIGHRDSPCGNYLQAQCYKNVFINKKRGPRKNKTIRIIVWYSFWQITNPKAL